MPQFHETGYGRTYYEHQLPELISQLSQIAKELRKLNEINETKTQDRNGKDTDISGGIPGEN